MANSAPDPTPAPLAPEGTRAALLDAGLHLFGVRGFDGTSIRDIATAAGTNIASIAYHFGGKDGLRLACGAEFARRIRHEIAPLLSAPDMNAPPAPDRAAQQLEAILRRMTRFMTGAPEAQDLAAFMLREVAADSPVVDTIYDTLMDPTHRHFCALWSAATGQPAESEMVRLRVFSILGQVVYFRIASPIVRRRMGWTRPGPAEIAATTAVLVANLHALLALDRIT